MSYLKNTAGQYLYFALINASDGSAITTGTVTGNRTIDGGTQTAVTGTISHKGNGQWELALSQADTNGDEIGFLFTHTSSIPISITIVTDTKKNSDLQDLTAAQVNSECDTALADYGANTTTPPTAAAIRQEMDANSTDLDSIISYVDELESRLTAARAALLDNLDAAITTRLATSGYTAPDNASITLILSDTDFLQTLLAELITGTTPNRQYTTTALANAPSGGGGSLTVTDFFDTDSGETAATAVAGSVVGEIVSSIAGGGIPGSEEITDIQITDGSDPIEGAAVWISTDAAGTNVIWNGNTNATGYPKDAGGNNPFLDPGTYYIWVQKGGYTFTNPTTETVT